MKKHLQALIETACAAGVSDARLISPQRLVVQEKFVEYCLTPKCRNYGLSAGCPPHVAGPQQFRRWREEAVHALVVRLDVPAKLLFTPKRIDVFRKLHRSVATVELQAAGMAYPCSRGFAGGSCKDIFCRDNKECLQLSSQGVCRNPLEARPSLSGFGVDVGKMMAAAGWSDAIPAVETTMEESVSWVAGLVLLSRKKDGYLRGPAGSEEVLSFRRRAPCLKI